MLFIPSPLKSRESSKIGSSGVPRGVEIIDHEPIDASALLKKSESIPDGVERVRRRGRELGADLHRVRSAPRPLAERKQAMREQVAGWVEAGRPNVSASIALGDDVEFETESQQVDVHSDPRTLGFVEMPNTVAMLAWLDPDRMIARLDQELTEEAGNDADALTDVDRQKAEAEIQSDMLECERTEVGLIQLAETQGLNIGYRPDTHPQALLGVQLVTQGRPTLLSLVSNVVGK